VQPLHHAETFEERLKSLLVQWCWLSRFVGLRDRATAHRAIPIRFR